MTPDQITIRALQRDIATMQEVIDTQVAQLRSLQNLITPQDYPVAVYMLRFKFSPTEAGLFNIIRLKSGRAGTGGVSKKTLYEHLYWQRDHSAPSIKVIDVLMCKVRHKLKVQKAPVYVLTLCGLGYCLDGNVDWLHEISTPPTAEPQERAA
jgi:DNA-binding response OmpR family regulator